MSYVRPKFSMRMILLTTSIGILLIICAVLMNQYLPASWLRVDSQKGAPLDLLVGGIGVFILVVFVISMIIANLIFGLFNWLDSRRERKNSHA